MAEHDQQALELFESGLSYSEIAECMGLTYKQVNHAINRARQQNTPPPENIDLTEEIHDQLNAGPRSREELCRKYKISNRVLTAAIEDLKDKGILIEERDKTLSLCKAILPQENIYEESWRGDKIIRFGVVADSHLCSKWQQLTHLNTLYDIFSKEGIDTVYNAGDLTEGYYKHRPEHIYEIFLIGADEQTDYVIDKYPYREGITTKFITGNHDHTHIKNGGTDIGIRINKERPDMEYLGMGNARVYLTPNCIMELNHALDGFAYALSYAMQKRIEAMQGGDKPNILIDGHHHKGLYIPCYRNIHGFEAGTTQAQTPWQRGKRISVMVGGWIITLHVDDEGTITRCAPEWIPFYKMIEKDY